MLPEPCLSERGCRTTTTCVRRKYCQERRYRDNNPDPTAGQEWSYRLDAAIAQANARSRSYGEHLFALVEGLLARPEPENCDEFGMLARKIRAHWNRGLN